MISSTTTMMMMMMNNLNTELLYLVGVSTVGAASIAYILFGPSPGSYLRRYNNKTLKNVPIRGLQNIKNNCFINSILQSIASSDSMRTWLECAYITTKLDGKLIHQISNIVHKINQDNDYHDEIITPNGVLNALREHRWIFSNEEQDAYELFNVLTSTLENELKHLSFMLSIREIFEHNEQTLSKIGNRAGNTSISCTRAAGKTTLVPHLNVTLPTRGILANHLVCQNCAYKYPLHLDLFDSITLSLPPAINYIAQLSAASQPSSSSSSFSIELEACLRKFVSHELIDDFMCESCSKRSKFDKKIEFIKLPKLLCIHLQRLVWTDTGGGGGSSQSMAMKRFDHVRFPEFLEMDPYTYRFAASHDSHPSSLPSKSAFVEQAALLGGKSLSDTNWKRNLPQTDNNSATRTNEDIAPVSSAANSSPKLIRYKYMLNSVIVHLGNSSSGHFICYRRRHDDDGSARDKWYCVSDLVVTKVSRSKVFSSSAYMLFYERIFDRLI